MFVVSFQIKAQHEMFQSKIFYCFFEKKKKNKNNQKPKAKQKQKSIRIQNGEVSSESTIMRDTSQ